MAQTKAAQWVTLTEDDNHTTSACPAGYGALVKNQSFEKRRIEGGMNISMQVGESMVYVPNVMVEQNDNGWVLTPHFPK